jgi:nucleoside-triphosphatase THEP1
MNQEIPNPELKLAFDFVEQTNINLFLTGKAGTGKTTFLRNLRALSPKRMIVVAPTGVAAINAGGVTIHSFFQLHFGPHVPGQDGPEASSGDQLQTALDRVQRFSREKINIMRSLDLLVIDEISMVRADLLDAIDGVLRRFKDRDKPFGGVQLLMIGDLQQLAPVA